MSATEVSDRPSPDRPPRNTAGDKLRFVLRGIGQTGTALPGEVDNFAVDGHRLGKGEPFLNLDRLRPGDAVIVETESHWYVSRVKGQQHGLARRDADAIPGSGRSDKMPPAIARLYSEVPS